jgi:hypothetical protein
VPVGFALAEALALPLDVLVVRQLSVPGHTTLSMGAMSTDGHRLLSDNLVEQEQISQVDLEAAISEQSTAMAKSGTTNSRPHQARGTRYSSTASPAGTMLARRMDGSAKRRLARLHAQAQMGAMMTKQLT